MFCLKVGIFQCIYTFNKSHLNSVILLVFLLCGKFQICGVFYIRYPTLCSSDVKTMSVMFFCWTGLCTNRTSDGVTIDTSPPTITGSIERIPTLGMLVSNYQVSKDQGDYNYHEIIPI